MILGFIDPCHYVSYILSRNNCIRRENGNYLKDLRFINRDLKDCVAVDNSIISFLGQINNLIPIKSFRGDSEDNELLKVLKFLISTRCCNDHRAEISNKYMLSKFVERYMSS